MEEFNNNVLPEDFDGTFKFSNPDDEDFVGKWGGKAYLYPAKKTVPMIIVDATPFEVQNIRMKFAKELGEKMFFKSKEYKNLVRTEKNSDGTPKYDSLFKGGQYNTDMLTEYIQACLKPFPVEKQVIKELPKIDITSRLSKDEDGEPNTQIAVKGRPLKLKDKEGAV